MTTNESKKDRTLCLANEEIDALISEEFQFKLLIPSLENMTGTKVVLALWSQKFTETPSQPFNCSKIRELMSDVYDLVFQLQLPYSLKKKMFRRNEQIAKELYTFCEHLMYNFEFANISWCKFDDIVWYPRGIINYARSIEMVINCSISRRKKDAIACVYGFVDKLLPQFSQLYVYEEWENPYDVFFMTNYVLLDDQHPVMMKYWESGDDERKIFVYEWLEMNLKFHRLQDICFLLAKLSDVMLRMVLLTWKDQLLRIFSNDLFHDDYFWQLATLTAKITDEKRVILNAESPDFCDGQKFILLQDVKMLMLRLKQ